MAEAKQKAKKSKKQRKVGRNAQFCLRYRNERRGEKSQCLRLSKHLMRHRNDTVAKKRHTELTNLLGW